MKNYGTQKKKEEGGEPLFFLRGSCPHSGQHKLGTDIEHVEYDPARLHKPRPILGMTLNHLMIDDWPYKIGISPSGKCSSTSALECSPS